MENEQNIQITVSDLAMLKSIVDVSASRGAFKADEMRTVGEVYEKLTKFLDSVVKQNEETAEGEEGAEEAPEKGDE